MASIKGFQMKNIKKTQGIEGCGCTATMYLNGKKIGTFADYGDGGPEDVKYVSKEAEMNMMKVIIEYAKENPDEAIMEIYKSRPNQYKEECKKFKQFHPYIPDEDITLATMSSNSIVYIVAEFLDLWTIEKLFKKYQKEGYKAIAVDEEKVHVYHANWSDNKIRERAKGKTLYMSLEDFCK